MLPEFGGRGGARFVNGTGKYLTQGGTGTTMGASADDFSDDFTPTSFLHLWVEDIPVSQWLYLRVMAANVVGYGPPQTLSLNGTEPTSVRMNGHFYMERFDPKNPHTSPPIHPPTPNNPFTTRQIVVNFQLARHFQQPEIPILPTRAFLFCNAAGSSRACTSSSPELLRMPSGANCDATASTTPTRCTLLPGSHCNDFSRMYTSST